MTASIPSIASPEPDALASGEAILYDQGTLEKEAHKNEHNRRENFRRHVGYIAVAFCWMLVIGVTGLAITWFWHLITPESLHYLAEDKIDKIQGILFSALAARLVPDYAKKYL